MIELMVLGGYCTIQLYRKVSGSNAHPHTIVWEVCGNTLVDECNFSWLNQYRWIMVWEPTGKCYYVVRVERIVNGKHLTIRMAREILKMSRYPGNNANKADHMNHDTFDHSQNNLRVVTSSKSSINRRTRNGSCRFKGIIPQRLGFQARIWHNGKYVCFLTMKLEIEAGLMFYYASKLLHGEFCCHSIFPENEMPPEDRQQELWEIVIRKLELVVVR